MLPKIHRLTKKKDFEVIFRDGKYIKSNFLILRVLRNALEENRVGFVVSKKISSKAVMRNKVKRRLRSVVSKNIHNVKKPFDVVIVALPGIEKETFLDTEEMVINALKKI